MYQPFHPAIIRMLRQAVRAARQAKIKVSLCGEMAGDPLCVFILLGLGIQELSMNAGSIPIVKQLIRSISMEDAKRHFQSVLKLDTAQDVKEYLSREMRSLSPDLEGAGYYE
jgi:phosphotransferase system enzyme I (PtsI)